MGLLFDEIGGERALGQQGVAGHILAGNITAFKQRDRHADFVGTFLLLTARYGEGGDFFWAWQVFDSCPTTLRICT